MEYLDSEKVFENAILKGLENPSEYMYMYSKNGVDYFKNINTRKYIEIEREKK